MCDLLCPFTGMWFGVTSNHRPDNLSQDLQHSKASKRRKPSPLDSNGVSRDSGGDKFLLPRRKREKDEDGTRVLPLVHSRDLSAERGISDTLGSTPRGTRTLIFTGVELRGCVFSPGSDVLSSATRCGRESCGIPTDYRSCESCHQQMHQKEIFLPSRPVKSISRTYVSFHKPTSP